MASFTTHPTSEFLRFGSVPKKFMWYVWTKGVTTCLPPASFPGCVGGENVAWYTVLAHVRAFPETWDFKAVHTGPHSLLPRGLGTRLAYPKLKSGEVPIIVQNGRHV